MSKNNKKATIKHSKMIMIIVLTLISLFGLFTVVFAQVPTPTPTPFFTPTPMETWTPTIIPTLPPTLI